MKNQKIQSILSNGAKTVSEVWYEFDKDKFDDAPNFQKILKHVMENDTNRSSK